MLLVYLRACTLQGRAEQDTKFVQGAVHAVIMQNRLRHAEEKVHNGDVQPRETFLSDPEAFKRMEEAARYALSPAVQAKHVHTNDRKGRSEQTVQEAGIGHVLRDQQGFSERGNAALGSLVKRVKKCSANAPPEILIRLCTCRRSEQRHAPASEKSSQSES